MERPPRRRPARSAALLARAAALALALAAAGAEPAAEPPPPPAAAPPALDIAPAAPPAGAAELHDWHRRYVVRSAPVRAALARLLAARQEPRPDRYQARVRGAARDLAAAIDRSPVPLPTTDRAARFLVRRTYFHLQQAAGAGAAGRFEAMELELQRSAGFLREAARVLERYGLTPWPEP